MTRPSISGTLNDLLGRAGVGKTDAISVVGPGGLSALLWLCRRGYQHVSYVGHGRGPRETVDVLLAPQAHDVAELDEMLREGPRPRDGGVLIIQTPEKGANGDEAVRGLLARAGYKVERRLHGRHRDVHVARREAPTTATRAA